MSEDEYFSELFPPIDYKARAKRGFLWLGCAFLLLILAAVTQSDAVGYAFVPAAFAAWYYLFFRIVFSRGWRRFYRYNVPPERRWVYDESAFWRWALDMRTW
ncbi:MAG: hypothetical protein MK180_08635 [Rhodobacteraceae bacterium]|nr:hypothetical protein [Paracoccaceae bacterium]